MGTEANVTGMARLLYIACGAGAASWALWGAGQGAAQWIWLALGGAVIVLGIIGYSPLHALFGGKQRRPN